MGYKNSKGNLHYCYRLLTNGFKIQWGIYQKANGATISYPLSFDSIPIVIAHLTEYVTTHSVIDDVSKTSFKTKASQYSTAGEQRNGNYIALGY